MPLTGKTLHEADDLLMVVAEGGMSSPGSFWAAVPQLGAKMYSEVRPC